MKSSEQAAFKAILIITMIIAVALLPVVAKAEPVEPQVPPVFIKMDVDADGFVSEEEFTTFRAARMAAKAEAGKPMKGAATAPDFSEIDTDGDGKLNVNEMTAAQQAHRNTMREQHGKDGGHGMGMHHGKGMNMPTFMDLDLNGDGCIDADEFAKHQAERHGKSQAAEE